jgi:hypothetical protein
MLFRNLMASSIVLNCSILGDKTHHHLSIEIPPTANINMPRRAIKEEHMPKL